MQLPFTDVLIDDIYISSAGRWFVLVWLVLLGGAIGSFMNVVVYRLPLGMSLSHPGSRCPACKHSIRWYDNVPVLGWWMLRGRCRDCGAAISPRYPLVEALVAAIAALLAWTEAMPAVVQPVPDLDETFVLQLGLYAFHFLLVCTLLCAALMEFDGHVPPRRMLVSVLLVGFIVPILQPNLRPTGSVLLPADWQVRGLVDGVAGGLAALVLSIVPWFAWFGAARQSRFAYASAAACELLIVGVFLGDQAVISIGLGSMVLYFVSQLLARKWPGVGRFGWAGPLVVVTLTWLVAGHRVLPLPKALANNDFLGLVAGATIMAIMAIILQIVQPLEDKSKLG